MRVLVTEDDDNLRVALDAALRVDGFAVDVVPDLAAADLALAVNSYDCAVFDRKLPYGNKMVDALGYVRRRRTENWPVPVLFLTALDSPSDVVDGLRLGCDYLVKPFAMPELLARVRSLCRRSAAGRRSAVLRCADVELDTGSRQVRQAGVLLTLTPKEFLVLEKLMAQPGTPVSRRELIEYAWDTMADPRTNVLDVVIAQLRRKLRNPPLIHAVRGAGYLITA